MTDRPTVIVVGLGPAGPEYLTAAAAEVLAGASALFLRTARHPAAAPFLARATTFDHHYEHEETFAATYAAIVEDLVVAATTTSGVVYGVPGSPNVLESTVEALRGDPRITTVTVAGLSFLDLAWDRLGVDPVNAAVRLVNGEAFSTDAAADHGPLLVSHTWSPAILSEVKLALDDATGTAAVILHHLGLPDERVVEVEWADLDRTIAADHLTCVYIPVLARPPAYELARAADVVATLRVSCPWDAAQTHDSLVRHLLEETYETIEAIDDLGDPPDLGASEHLEEELGDLLCQVLFHAVLAEEEGLFALSDVAAHLADKLVARHPHVFSATDAPLADAEAVLSAWEEHKRVEKGRTSVLDGIPAALPALAYLAKVEKKAATIGLGLPPQLPAEAMTFLSARIEALLAGDEEVTGEVLAYLARLATAAGADPEQALRRAGRALDGAVRAAEAAAGSAAAGGLPAQ